VLLLLIVIDTLLTLEALSLLPPPPHPARPLDARRGEGRHRWLLIEPTYSGFWPNGFVLVQAEGDWKYVRETFHFTGYNNDSCCQYCMASKTQTELFYTRCDEAAPWRNHLISHQRYLAGKAKEGGQSQKRMWKSLTDKC